MAGRASKRPAAKPARRKGDRRRLKVDPSKIVYIDDKGIHTGLSERRTGKDRRRATPARDRR